MARRWLRARAVRRAGVALLALLVLIQVVPYGHAHTNPAVTGEPPWDTPRTRALTVAACYDCHSNETTWKWYTTVAPFSWLTQNDVDAGRRTLNFSEWDRGQRTDDIVEVTRSGDMPPWYYTPLHPAARLSAQEQRELVDGFLATFGEGDAGR
jgi:hypothetical protein